MSDKTPNKVLKEERRRRKAKAVEETGLGAAAASSKIAKYKVQKIWEKERLRNNAPTSAEESTYTDSEALAEEEWPKPRSQAQKDTIRKARNKSPSAKLNNLKTITKNSMKKKPTKKQAEEDFTTVAQLPYNARTIPTRSTYLNNFNAYNEDEKASKGSLDNLQITTNSQLDEENPNTSQRQSPQKEHQQNQATPTTHFRDADPLTMHSATKPPEVSIVQHIVHESPQSGGYVKLDLSQIQRREDGRQPYHSTPHIQNQQKAPEPKPQRHNQTQNEKQAKHTEQKEHNIKLLSKQLGSNYSHSEEECTSSAEGSIFSVTGVLQTTKEECSNMDSRELYISILDQLELLRPTNLNAETIIHNLESAIQVLRKRHLHANEKLDEAQIQLDYATNNILKHIHQPMKDTNKPQPQEPTHQVIIKPISKDLPKTDITDTLEAIGKQSNIHAQAINTYSDIIKIKVKTVKEAQTIVKEMERIPKLKEKVSAKVTPQPSTKVMIYNVPEHLDESQIKKHLMQEATFNDISSIKRIRTFKSKHNGKQHWAMELETQAARKLLHLKRIYINLTTCKITRFMTPLRCRRCQAYGHNYNECRRRHPNCANCAEPHDTEECKQQHPEQCINCTNENKKGHQHDIAHTASSNKCAVFRTQTAYLARKVNQNTRN